MPEQNSSEKPTRQTLGQVKVEICQRLGDGWRELASYFRIPRHEEARFGHGDECRDIWVVIGSKTEKSKSNQWAANVSAKLESLAV